MTARKRLRRLNEALGIFMSGLGNLKPSTLPAEKQNTVRTGLARLWPIEGVLLPLDLALSTMDDPHDLLDRGRFVFDTVLLDEGVVPTAGFHAKSVQKLTTGYASVV